MKFNDFEIVTRSRSVSAAVSSRSELEGLAISAELRSRQSVTCATHLSRAR
jgi:hypothetical protein